MLGPLPSPSGPSPEDRHARQLALSSHAGRLNGVLADSHGTAPPRLLCCARLRAPPRAMSSRRTGSHRSAFVLANSSAARAMGASVLRTHAATGRFCARLTPPTARSALVFAARSDGTLASSLLSGSNRTPRSRPRSLCPPDARAPPRRALVLRSRSGRHSLPPRSPTRSCARRTASIVLNRRTGCQHARWLVSWLARRFASSQAFRVGI